MRYLDTSSLVALYYPEAKTSALIAHLQKHPAPLAFTWLHEMEFTNGLQLKLFRKEATDEAIAATLRTLRVDVETAVFHQTPLSWPAIFATASRLSTTHSRTLGTRTLDLLHIAAAISMQATEFVTGDERQAKAALAEKLNVIGI